MAHIKTYARLKPAADPYEDLDYSDTLVYLRVPETLRDGGLGGASRFRGNKVNHEFRFDRVFNKTSSQEEIFDCVAKPIIQGFLDGYNGTIFAYGQTGSGKTYTVEGSARRYDDRGLAPRAISFVYKALEDRPQEEITVHISYMEIYQEVGYDLLNTAARNASFVAPFPKVAVVEGPKGAPVIRNLSSHLAANEEVAQHLLLQGQANRKVAETPMNLRSSRSHAVLTIQLTWKKPGSEVITKSKLHLVDLAGSERVSKTGIAGLQLAEAKYINLSLHYLEGVIIALQEEATGSQQRVGRYQSAALWVDRIGKQRPKIHKSHTRYASPYAKSWASRLRPSSADGIRRAAAGKYIPYRNSLLTMVLRDSLGGNCQTAMIATISMEEENIGETVSTCRFSQRVACITNKVRKNEEIDDRVLIKKLRKRIGELEVEVAMLRTGQVLAIDSDRMGDSKLTDEEKLECVRITQEFIQGRLRDPITSGVTSPAKFRECMRLLKVMIMDGHVKVDFPPRDTHSNISQSAVALETRTSQTLGLITGTRVNPSSGRVKSAQPHRSSEITHSQVPNRQPNQGSITNGSAGDLDQPVREAWAQHSGKETGGFRPRTKKPMTTKGTKSETDRDTEKLKPQEVYKSPYQKKQEQAAVNLHRKVEKTKQEQEDQQHHLEAMQVTLQEQQLQMLHSEIREKFQSVQDQLQTQHRHVHQLKTSHADRDLIHQERIVEKQLKKRQMKMEKRLEWVEEQLASVRHTKTENDTSEEENKKNTLSQQSLQQSYPQYVKKDGQLNTRQVLDILQLRDKQQDKIQAKLEKDKLMTLSQQLEVKEALTRQRLREFKERLQEAKASRSNSPVPRYAFGSMDDLQRESRSDDIPVRQGRPRTSPCGSRRHHNATDTYAEIQLEDMDDPGHSDKKQELFTKCRTSHMSDKENGNEAPNFIAKAAQLRSPDNFDTLKALLQTAKENRVDAASKWDSSYSGHRSVPDGVINGNMDSKQDTRTNGGCPVKNTSAHNDFLFGTGTQGNGIKPAGSFESLEHIPGFESTAQNTESADISKSEPRPYPDKVYTPSEYIYQGHDTHFDARAMSLVGRSFESTLNSMLDVTKQNKTHKKHYDQFARGERSEGGKTRSRSRKGTRSQVKVMAQRNVSSVDDSCCRKNDLSLEERLKEYLTDVDTSINKHKHTSYDDSVVDTGKVSEPVHQTTDSHKARPVVDMDVDDFKPKIKALSANVSENKYMSTAKEQKQRVARIRQARSAAETIQRAWRRYKVKKR